MTLVLAEPPPLENYANPTTSGYIPLPDWYFLFLYQLLKYQFAAGPYILFGILIIPGLAFGALLLAPFLDNGPGRRPPQRPIAVRSEERRVGKECRVRREASAYKRKMQTQERKVDCDV